MSHLLGPRDDNGIPLPMTVDESIASMKTALLKKLNAPPTFIASTAVAVTAVKSRFSLPFPRYSMLNVSASKWCRRRATPIFCCSPAR